MAPWLVFSPLISENGYYQRLCPVDGENYGFTLYTIELFLRWDDKTKTARRFGYFVYAICIAISPPIPIPPRNLIGWVHVPYGHRVLFRFNFTDDDSICGDVMSEFVLYYSIKSLERWFKSSQFFRRIRSVVPFIEPYVAKLIKNHLRYRTKKVSSGINSLLHWLNCNDVLVPMDKWLWYS